MKITITQARANLQALWDKIERTRRPVTIRRRGHADMVLLVAADFDRLHDHLRAMSLAIRRRHGDPHPSTGREALPALLKRIAALSSGVPIDHDTALDEVTAAFDAQGERMQDQRYGRRRSAASRQTRAGTFKGDSENPQTSTEEGERGGQRRLRATVCLRP